MEAIEDSQETAEGAFMGTKTDVWKHDIQMNGGLVNFKIDTGAAVTAIPESVYSRARDGELQKAQRLICGPNNQPLTVLGTFNACLKKGKQTTKQ